MRSWRPRPTPRLSPPTSRPFSSLSLVDFLPSVHPSLDAWKNPPIHPFYQLKSTGYLMYFDEGKFRPSCLISISSQKVTATLTTRQTLPSPSKRGYSQATNVHSPLLFPLVRIPLMSWYASVKQKFPFFIFGEKNCWLSMLSYYAFVGTNTCSFHISSGSFTVIVFGDNSFATVIK